MKGPILIIFLPLAAVFLIWLLRPEIIVGHDDLNASMIWTLIGTIFGYLGFAFSLFAVLEVKELSGRYFSKQRLPEMKRQLDKISTRMITVSNTTLVKIRTEKFVTEAAVVIRHIKKTKTPGFNDTVKKAEMEQKSFEGILKGHVLSNTIANDQKEYWNLFRALSELSDEIDAYNKGVKASI